MAHHFLPREMIYEILTRTSLIGVGRCRLVSKEWNLMTYESNFKQDHCQRTNTISGFLTQLLPWKAQFISTTDLNQDYEFSLGFLPFSVCIKAATKQGILLCIYCWRTIPQYYVCKPSTKEWHQIPNDRTYVDEFNELLPRTDEFGMVIRKADQFGMVVLKSNPLRYKIVRFSLQKEVGCNLGKDELDIDMGYKIARCEIFDSKTSAWKKIPHALVPTDKFTKLESHVSVGGRLYWLKCNYVKSNYFKNKYGVFEFREDTESWLTFNLPFSFTRYRKNYFDSIKLVDYQGRLALVCTRENDVLLWAMKDNNKKLWSRRRTIRTETGHRFAWMYGSDAALLERRYNNKFCYMFPFQSDFEPLNLNDIGEKKRKRNS